MARMMRRMHRTDYDRLAERISELEGRFESHEHNLSIPITPRRAA